MILCLVVVNKALKPKCAVTPVIAFRVKVKSLTRFAGCGIYINNTLKFRLLRVDLKKSQDFCM